MPATAMHQSSSVSSSSVARAASLHRRLRFKAHGAQTFDDDARLKGAAPARGEFAGREVHARGLDAGERTDPTLDAFQAGSAMSTTHAELELLRAVFRMRTKAAAFAAASASRRGDLTRP